MLKNPNDDSKLNLQAILEKNLINSIFCSDPFLKAGFISKLVQDTKLDVLYLDLDLMYSGYLISGILPSIKNVKLYQPTSETLYQTIKEILIKASMSQTIIIIDSLNGIFNILNRKKNVGKNVMSIIMLLASISRITSSYVIISSIVRYTKEGWILSSTGKRLIETKNSKKIILEYEKNGIEVIIPSDSIKLVIPSNLIPLT